MVFYHSFIDLISNYRVIWRSIFLQLGENSDFFTTFYFYFYRLYIMNTYLNNLLHYIIIMIPFYQCSFSDYYVNTIFLIINHHLIHDPLPLQIIIIPRTKWIIISRNFFLPSFFKITEIQLHKLYDVCRVCLYYSFRLQ